MSMIAAAAAIGGLVKIGMSYDWGGKRAKEQRDAKAAYEQQKSVYKGLDTSNPYENLQNRFADQENVFEDLTVNQQQAQFEAEQGQQQRANIMAGLQGAAGGSGIAGLAQAMAQQGQLATQRASASIGQQEAANQKLRAQEAARLQTLEAQGGAQVDQLKAQGQFQSQQMEMGKQATLLGMDANRVAAAQADIAANKAAMMSGVGDIVGGISQAGQLSTTSKGKYDPNTGELI